LRKVLNDCIS